MISVSVSALLAGNFSQGKDITNFSIFVDEQSVLESMIESVTGCKTRTGEKKKSILHILLKRQDEKMTGEQNDRRTG